MAAPQSFVPPRVRPSRPSRKFTVQQANSTLPLVKRIVGDVVRVNADAVKIQEAMEITKESKKQTELQKDLESKAARMNELIGELSGIGVELKDPAIGLIDFIGRHQGRDVYLCWKLGEESIGFWHDLQAGVAGRKPINTLQEGEAEAE